MNFMGGKLLIDMSVEALMLTLRRNVSVMEIMI